MAIDAIDDHASAAQARLLQQFKGRPRLAALINLLAEQVQSLEDAGNAQPIACEVVNAAGAQLDGLGSIVGEARGSMGDPLYRLFVLGKIGTNASHATQEELLRLTMTLFQASSAAIRDAFTPGNGKLQAPMAIGIEIGAPALPEQYYPTALALIRQAMAAGVVLSWVTVYSDDAFALAADTPGVGLASDDGKVQGGALATQIFTSTI